MLRADCNTMTKSKWSSDAKSHQVIDCLISAAIIRVVIYRRGKTMATNAVMTWEEFLAAGKEGQRWEYVDGEVAFMSPVFRPHGRVNLKLDAALDAYTTANP